MSGICAQLGERFRFFHFDPMAGFKAGALNFVLRETAPDAQIIGVIDSDYRSRRTGCSDWCRTSTIAKSASCSRRRTIATGDGERFKAMCYWEYAGFFDIGMFTAQRAQRDHPARHHDPGPARR